MHACMQGSNTVLIQCIDFEVTCIMVDKASAHYAEQHAGNIFAITEKWSHSDSEITEDNENTVGGFYGGLYLFYLRHLTKPHKTENKFPIYIGCTRRTFRKCFQEYACKGVIKKWRSGEFPGSEGYKLFVLQFHMGHITAKVIESIFLDAYNFALNRDENGDVRASLDLCRNYSLEESRDWFKEVYEKIMDELYSMNKQKFALMKYDPSKSNSLRSWSELYIKERTLDSRSLY